MSKYLFHLGVEIFIFQPEVKGTCISKKTHPGVNFTLHTCNMPVTLDTLHHRYKLHHKYK